MGIVIRFEADRKISVCKKNNGAISRREYTAIPPI
jgi:hypothetical protein